MEQQCSCLADGGRVQALRIGSSSYTHYATPDRDSSGIGKSPSVWVSATPERSSIAFQRTSEIPALLLELKEEVGGSDGVSQEVGGPETGMKPCGQ